MSGKPVRSRNTVAAMMISEVVGHALRVAGGEGAELFERLKQRSTRLRPA